MGDSSAIEMRLKFTRGSIQGKRLEEDILSWRYIGFASGLLNAFKNRLHNEFISEKTRICNSLESEPALAKARLVQLVLGITGLKGEVIFKEVQKSEAPFFIQSRDSRSFNTNRIIEVDEQETMIWAFLRVLHTTGVPFSFQEIGQFRVRIYADFLLM